MKEPKTLFAAVGDVLGEIERVGLHEALGIEPVPDSRVVDPSKCRCGGGCESVLECEFWYFVRKTRQMERKANRQVQIGKYRVDSLFDCDGQKVVVELDGKQFHNACDDYVRDCGILEEVDAIIRVPFSAIHYYHAATFAILASWYPRFEIPADQFCLHAAQLKREMCGDVNPDGDFPTEAKWIEWADPNFDIWAATSSIGWAGSVKAWLHCWNVIPITRATKEFRGDCLQRSAALQSVRRHVGSVEDEEAEGEG